MAHNDDKKCMALTDTACNKDNDLVDQGNNKGNGGGVDDDNDVIVGAQR